MRQSRTCLKSRPLDCPRKKDSNPLPSIVKQLKQIVQRLVGNLERQGRSHYSQSATVRSHMAN